MWSAEQRVAELVGEPTYGFLWWQESLETKFQKELSSFFENQNKTKSVEIFQKPFMRLVLFEMMEYLYSDYLGRDEVYLVDKYENSRADERVRTFFDCFTLLSCHYSMIPVSSDGFHLELMPGIFTLCRFAPFLDAGMWVRGKQRIWVSDSNVSWTRWWLRSIFTNKESPRPLWQWSGNIEIATHLFLSYVNQVCHASTDGVSFSNAKKRNFSAEVYLKRLINYAENPDETKNAVNCILAIFWLCDEGKKNEDIRKRMFGYIIVVILNSRHNIKNKDDIETNRIQEYIILNFAPIVQCMYMEEEIKQQMAEQKREGAHQIFTMTLQRTVEFLDMMMYSGYHVDNKIEPVFSSQIFFPEQYKDLSLEVLTSSNVVSKFSIEPERIVLNVPEGMCVKVQNTSTWELMKTPRSYKEYTADDAIENDERLSKWKYEDYRSEFVPSKQYATTCGDVRCSSIYCAPENIPFCDNWNVGDGSNGCKYKKEFLNLWQKCPSGTEAASKSNDGWVHCVPEEVGPLPKVV